MAQIHERICEAMKDIPAIAKKNQPKSGVKYNFRGIDDVMNELNPIFAKHGIFVYPDVINNEIREIESVDYEGKPQLIIHVLLTIKYHFTAADGSEVVSTVIGEAMDYGGDKATNKALSIAFKYACLQLFCIPTEDEKDPDFSQPKIEPKKENYKGQNELMAQEKNKALKISLDEIMKDECFTEQERKDILSKRKKYAEEIANLSERNDVLSDLLEQMKKIKQDRFDNSIPFENDIPEIKEPVQPEIW